MWVLLCRPAIIRAIILKTRIVGLDILEVGILAIIYSLFMGF